MSEISWCALCLLAFASIGPASPAEVVPHADEIMRQVAQNQDREQKDRLQFVFDEHIRVMLRRTNGKLAREESSDLQMTPTAKGIAAKLLRIEGRYVKKGQVQSFQGEPIPEPDSLDGSLASSFRTDLTGQDDSKDGIGKDLFPLTTDQQQDLRFELEGEEIVGGRPAYRIKFGPKEKDDFAWAGEALIDKEELQPVTVFTRLSRRLPFVVRTLLGTDVPGLGFTVQYTRVAKDVWFPASFGTEFRLRAVFFINRNISVSLENKNFKRTTVDSQIKYSDQAFEKPVTP